MNKESLRETNNILRAWGKWTVFCLSMGLKIASKSTIVSALQGSRATVAPQPKDNPELEKINILVFEISRKWPQVGQVLRAEYTEQGSKKDKMIKAGVKSLSNYKRLLEMAIFSIDQSISICNFMHNASKELPIK